MDQFEAEAGQRKEATEHGNAFFRLGVPPHQPASTFRPMASGLCQEQVLRFKHNARVARDNTVLIPDAHHAVVAKPGAFRLRRGSRGSSRMPGWPVASPPRGEHSPFPGSATQPTIRKKWSSTVSDGDCPFFHRQRPGPGLDIDPPAAKAK